MLGSGDRKKSVKSVCGKREREGASTAETAFIKESKNSNKPERGGEGSGHFAAVISEVKLS